MRRTENELLHITGTNDGYEFTFPSTFINIQQKHTKENTEKSCHVISSKEEREDILVEGLLNITLTSISVDSQNLEEQFINSRS